jgi:hypothetical protein
MGVRGTPLARVSSKSLQWFIGDQVSPHVHHERTTLSIYLARLFGMRGSMRGSPEFGGNKGWAPKAKRLLMSRATDVPLGDVLQWQASILVLYDGMHHYMYTS